LRRLKKDVLQELPPKIESKVLTDLTGEQKKIYLTYLQKAKGEIEEAIAARGFEKSQIKILSALTRLRQICCHPATFLENYQGDSGKLIYLREMMQDAVKSGHRILLFSQFTAMLEIIRQQLDNEQITYFYLDGSTKTEERTRMVRAFNRGEGDAFLISLKAGGTGLNLTGADMVIHYDPWWNPAVEEQATDRAYRIGQKNSVQVIKLITRGTIEEKIYELQQKKKAMIDSVIKPGETMLSKMTEQEVRELFGAGL
jgi:SNF2 family DNA or RNA helicase